MTPARVPDATVLAALAFGESLGERALRELAGAELVAPGLLRYELAEIARRKLRANPSLHDAILEGLGIVQSLPIRYLEPEPAALLELALRRNLSPRDSAYVWTSRVMGARLLSFDGLLASQPESLKDSSASSGGEPSRTRLKAAAPGRGTRSSGKASSRRKR